MLSGAAKTVIGERDLSARASTTRGIYMGMVIPAVRGPLKPTLVTNATQFLDRFTPNGKILVGYDSAYFEALIALADTNKLVVMRAQSGALHGGVYIKASGSADDNGELEFGLESPDDDYDLTSLDGRVILSPAAVTFDTAQNLMTVPQTVYDLIDTGDACQLTTSGTLPSPLALATTYYIYKSATNRKVGLATSSPNASAGTLIDLASFGVGTHTLTVSNKTVAGTFTADASFDKLTVPSSLYSAIDTGDACTVSTDGTLPAGITNGPTYYVIKTGVSPEVKLATTLSNAQNGVAIDLTDTGSGTHTLTLSSKQLGGAATVDMADDTLTVNTTWYNASQTGDEVEFNIVSGTLPTGVVADTTYYLIKTNVSGKVKVATTSENAENGVAIDFVGDVPGTATLSNNSMSAETEIDQKLFILYGADPGEWNNDIGVKITSYASNPVKVKEPNTFLIEVYYGTALKESWICSRDPNLKSGRGQPTYIEEVLKGSAYIRAIDNIAIASTTLPKNQSTILTFGNGDDGDAITDGVMITALGELEACDYNIALLPDSGWTTPSYQQAIIDFCESKGDCAFTFSVPYANEASADYINEITSYKLDDLASDSSYGGIWSSHLLIKDRDNNRDLYVAPSAHIAARIARLWDLSVPWEPAAGYTNGRLNVLGVHRQFTEGEEDTLYDHNINPIRWKRGTGAVIWGQKTLQSRPTDLDRMHARMLLCVIKPALKEIADEFLFSLADIQNDAGQRAQLIARINSYMEGIQARNGVYAFKVVCDESNNSAIDVQNKTLRVWLLIQIIQDTEYIEFDIGVSSYGLDFALAEQALAA